MHEARVSSTSINLGSKVLIFEKLRAVEWSVWMTSHILPSKVGTKCKKVIMMSTLAPRATRTHFPLSLILGLQRTSILVWRGVSMRLMIQRKQKEIIDE